MVLPEGALQSVVGQLIPEEALHLAAGAGPRGDLGALYKGCWGSSAQACDKHARLTMYYVLQQVVSNT